MTLTTEGIPIEVHLGPSEWAEALRREVAAGLVALPRELAPTWLYDDRGCELFDEITRLPEYYPTRTERWILGEHAADIAAAAGAECLVEIGAGTSEKTRVLLDAMAEGGDLRRVVLFDVAEPTLRATAEAIADEYPTVDVSGIVGDFRRHLGALGSGERRLIAFLGGTIGNLTPHARGAMLRELRATMAPGDAFLLGTDLVKDRARLVAAYDDAAGVTAAFNKNVLVVLNRELDANFDPEQFSHVACFDDEEEWIEMRLRSLRHQVVELRGLGLRIELEEGEDIRTEISAKFRREQLTAELRAAGLELVGWWTDPAGDYALSLSVR
jgi:L-histidine N-alpha-methyltransferase